MLHKDICVTDNFKTYETLQYSVRNMDNGTAETVCQLDTEVCLCVLMNVFKGNAEMLYCIMLTLMYETQDLCA